MPSTDETREGDRAAIASSEPVGDDLLAEGIAYYRARAAEYDQWFLRQGRYDRGPEATREWAAEVEVVAAALHTFHPTGRILELACGTGWWTEHLARYAARITAVDSSPEALALNSVRVGANVEYVEADLFSWRPLEQYDVVFFSFWLSHVPPRRFVAFWEMVRSCLAPNGRVFFVDSLYNEAATATDHRLEGAQATALTRRLNDGREFRIVKVYYEPQELQSKLTALGWQAAVGATPHHFLYGSAQTPRPERVGLQE